MHTLLLAYKQDIANLPKKMATGNEENLIPLNEVHKKLRQSIADEL
ncbi:MAG: hypothetical protein H6766_05480 [Candidatus Peribacteria bacterium]|nr:MAG: hypothetical protein H6766_05480 [Candidatus Peribacteria bacterium]